jgi:hypothetical protein
LSLFRLHLQILDKHKLLDTAWESPSPSLSSVYPSFSLLSSPIRTPHQIPRSFEESEALNARNLDKGIFELLGSVSDSEIVVGEVKSSSSIESPPFLLQELEEETQGFGFSSTEIFGGFAVGRKVVRISNFCFRHQRNPEHIRIAMGPWPRSRLGVCLCNRLWKFVFIWLDFGGRREREKK